MSNDYVLHLQATKLRHAPYGVCKGVGSSRHQSQAARNDLRERFVELEVANWWHKKKQRSWPAGSCCSSTTTAVHHRWKNDFHQTFVCFLADILNYCSRLTYPETVRKIKHVPR